MLVNQVENFWSLLKRGLKGTYVQVAPEVVFAYNKRDLNDFGRIIAFSAGSPDAASPTQLSPVRLRCCVKPLWRSRAFQPQPGSRFWGH